MQEIILMKLGELILKGLNRHTFEDKLLANLRRRLRTLQGGWKVLPLQAVAREGGRRRADLDDPPSGRLAP